MLVCGFVCLCVCCAYIYKCHVTETPANSSSSGQQLKEHLVDELDYVLLPAEGWNKMVAYYGIKEGQVRIFLCQLLLDSDTRSYPKKGTTHSEFQLADFYDSVGI